MLTEPQLIGFIEGTLGPDELAQVEAALSRDETRRKQVLEQVGLDAALRAALGGAPAGERVKQSILAVVRGESEAVIKQQVLHDTAGPPPRRRQPAQPAWLAAVSGRPAWAFSFAVACLCIFLGIWLAMRPVPTQPGSPAASVETPARVDFPAGTAYYPNHPAAEVVQSFRNAGSLVPKGGDGLRVSESGSATIRYADGTVLHLEPGTEIRFQALSNPPGRSGKQLRLVSGSLSADVAKQPPGLPLLIETPHTLVTVVGTEFDLLVGTNQTRIDVVRGVVNLASSGASQAVKVTAGESAVAGPESPPRASPLARNPYLWPFASDSPWNTPLSGSARFESVPGNPFLADGTLTDAMRSRKPFIGHSTDPLRNVWVNGQLRADTRLAENALPRAGLRDSIVLLQRGRRYALELRGVRVRADGDLEADAIERTDLAGLGANSFAVDAIPFGMSNLGGLIRAGEYERGISHALSARVRRDLLEGRDFAQPATVWPAVGNAAAAERSGLQVGTLLALPSDVDVRALVGDSGPGYELARAMQDYGVYVTGFINAPFVLLTGEERLDPHVEDELLNRLVPRLERVTNNSPQTPGGGGAPRRTPAPSLPVGSH